MKDLLFDLACQYWVKQTGNKKIAIKILSQFKKYLIDIEETYDSLTIIDTYTTDDGVYTVAEYQYN